MNESELAKCTCEHCGQGLEFPREGAGMTVQCPSCEHDCLLVASGGEEHSSNPSPVSEVSVSDVVAAFERNLSKTPVSFLYQAGLVAVALTMIVLPFLYLALVGAVAFAVYWWARNGTFVFVGSAGFHFMILQLVLYLAPLLGGLIAVFFMVKPILARRAPHAQPLAMNPGAEPVLFTFVSKICEAVGAPFPNRIDLNCHVNASAGFRRGLRSFLGNDLVLTIGLPLVAGVSARQLAGILAHEFGHFTQGFAMRLTYIIRSINAWFARVVYERDAWDITLQEWSETDDWRVSIIVGCARLAVWFSRQILRLLMMLGHAIGCFLLRQMEYDADGYEIRLVGSETFECTTKRFQVLSALLNPAYSTIQVGWNRGRHLPDNFPSHLVCHDAALPQEVRATIEDQAGIQPTNLFDTHPSNGDRIRQARRASEPGILQLDCAATALFSNFEAVAKQVTLLHYADDLRLPLHVAKLGPNQPSHPPDSDPSSSKPIRIKPNPQTGAATGLP
jgi:Zn-dependent protease with chaperone function